MSLFGAEQVYTCLEKVYMVYTTLPPDGRAHDWGYVDRGRLARRFTESSIVRVDGALRGTASLVIPSELPAAVVGVTRRGGPGPPLGLGARWVSESNLRGPQWLASCGRLSASPSEEWPTRSGPAFTCRRLGHHDFGLPRVGPSYLLEGYGPDQEEVAADAVY